MNAEIGKMGIGIWLGISHIVGGLISCWILTQKGTVISITTVQCITILEKETDEIKSIINEFDTDISCCFKEEEDRAYDGSNLNPED